MDTKGDPFGYGEAFMQERLRKLKEIGARVVNSGLTGPIAASVTRMQSALEAPSE